MALPVASAPLTNPTLNFVAPKERNMLADKCTLAKSLLCHQKANEEVVGQVCNDKHCHLMVIFFYIQGIQLVYTVK